MGRKNKQNITRVQHFIPRFILRRFTNKQGKTNFVDKRYGSKGKAPDGAMYKDFFYEHDDFNPNEIEDLLASRENIYAPIIEKILSYKTLTIDEHKILIEFRHTTYYRSNEFFGFHRFQKRRGENDWMERWDWKSINGLYSSDDWDKDIKKSQLRAIKSVISGDDAAYSVSLWTPICFLFTSKGKKFMVSDSGSLCRGDEMNGIVIIVLSPLHAIMFPRTIKAVELMEKLRVKNDQSTIIFEDISDKDVDIINKMVLEDSFEYYIDPNIN